jgi:hypothetical protein
VRLVKHRTWAGDPFETLDEGRSEHVLPFPMIY